MRASTQKRLFAERSHPRGSGRPGRTVALLVLLLVLALDQSSYFWPLGIVVRESKLACCSSSLLVTPLAPSRSASLRSAQLRSASLRLACPRSALSRSAPLRALENKLAPLRSAPLRLMMGPVPATLCTSLASTN